MKNIQVRHVPETTHRVLRRRAAKAGMSLQEYLLATLNEHARQPTVADVLERASGRSGGNISVADIVADIREDRDSR